MDERFVTLASLVVTARAPAASAEIAVASVTAAARVVSPATLDPVRADISRELALMRLAAIEAFERATIDLLARLARDVLVRELALAPSALAEIARQAIADYAACEPIGLVVAPCDARAITASLPVRIDASLEPGDLLVDVSDGVVESRFAFRVCEAVASAASVATAPA